MKTVLRTFATRKWPFPVQPSLGRNSSPSDIVVVDFVTLDPSKREKESFLNAARRKTKVRMLKGRRSSRANAKVVIQLLRRR